MRFRSRPPEDPEVNLTPLIDVVFLLLIFFMVSTTFERQSELAIELPESSTGEKAERIPEIRVAIDGQGRVYVNGNALVNRQRDTLRRALSALLKAQEAPPLVLEADRDAPYQAVVTVMDVARDLGLARLRFATRRSERTQ